MSPIGSLEAARTQIGADGFDVALIDIKLDQAMAYPLADMLVAQAIPFAFVTGYDQAAIPSHLADVPYLAKPAAAEALVELFGRLCA